jgi:DeoR family fructose operon transcriptional repressor
MLADERRFRIREILSVRRTIAASELCEKLDVTPVTIRRDLATLEAQGVLLRSHGGAISRMSSTNFQPAYEICCKAAARRKRPSPVLPNT